MRDLYSCIYHGQPVRPADLDTKYRKLVARAGVRYICIHSQRHTSVTLALAEGASILAVSERIGHARTSLTMDVYAHTDARQHRDVADRLGAALFGPDAAPGGVVDAR